MVETTVKQDLELFLNSKISAESLSSVDDIVLGYIVSVLEELGQDEHFDVDEFIAIMAAYIPGFEQVNRVEVCSWMFALADKLTRTTSTPGNPIEDSLEATDELHVHVDHGWVDSEQQEDPSVKYKPETQMTQECTDELSCSSGNIFPVGLKEINPGSCGCCRCGNKVQKDIREDKQVPLTRFPEHVQLLEELFPDVCIDKIERCLDAVNGNPEEAIDMILKEGTNQTYGEGKYSTHEKEYHDQRSKHTDAASSGSNASFSEKVSLLAEMFPDACSLDIKRCLLVGNGDPESAVRLLLLNKDSLDEEATEDYHHTQEIPMRAHQPSAKRQELQGRDKQDLKKQLMTRYGYVEVSEEEKTHQPTLYKQEQKKLVRYRNNQVVSTKGEKYSYEKQHESEDEKKTYINLKPARKYRFH